MISRNYFNDIYILFEKFYSIFFEMYVFISQKKKGISVFYSRIIYSSDNDKIHKIIV